MMQAHTEVPSFNLTSRIDMAGVARLRTQMKGTAVTPIPSVTDIVTAATARALRAFPTMNSSYIEDEFVFHQRVNIGIAVALDDLLVVPTLFDADLMTLPEISQATKVLVQSARDRSLSPAQLGGGTFTISNLGMFAVESFTPMINPPQAAILGVGRTAEHVSLIDGIAACTPSALFSVSCDHRLVYGADAARFLQHLGEVLRDPTQLLTPSHTSKGSSND